MLLSPMSIRGYINCYTTDSPMHATLDYGHLSFILKKIVPFSQTDVYNSSLKKRCSKLTCPYSVYVSCHDFCFKLYVLFFISTVTQQV